MGVLLVLALASVQLLTAGTPRPVAPQAWSVPLEQADVALRRGDGATALRAWGEARGAAIRSAHWEGMLAVGEAASRFGTNGRARARQAYLTALFRARRDGSLDGLLDAATGFGSLGDRDVLAYALRLADREAGHDSLRRARVRAVADRWMSPADSTLSGGQHR